jgi:transposase-like protein
MKKMVKIPRKAYTLEFKQEAVRLVESGQRVSEAARSLGIVEQTLANWVKAHRAGKLRGSGRNGELSAALDSVRALPGIESAGTNDALPFSGENTGGLVGRSAGGATQSGQITAEIDDVSAG